MTQNVPTQSVFSPAKLLDILCSTFWPEGDRFFLTGLCLARDPYFKSVPTTVKTSENDTVLLPCYVDDLGRCKSYHLLMILTLKHTHTHTHTDTDTHTHTHTHTRVRVYLSRILQEFCCTDSDICHINTACKITNTFLGCAVEFLYAVSFRK
jgi:hypothetical protein